MDDLHILVQKKREQIADYANKIGPPISPDRSLTIKTWKSYCDYCPPDTFLIMHNLVSHEITQTHNLKNIGFSLNTTNDIIQQTHENHKLQLLNSVYSVILLSLQNSSIKEMPDLTLTSLRTLKDISGEYQYMKTTTTPISTDKNGNIIEYVSWYSPVNSYYGQPFKSKLVSNKKSKQTFRIIDQYAQMLRESFDYLHFTKRQKEVIYLLNKKVSKSDIAQQLSISIRTVEKYKEVIFNKGKLLFSLNKFRSAEDVVFYISEMGFI